LRTALEDRKSPAPREPAQRLLLAPSAALRYHCAPPRHITNSRGE
jgi:hypothetical protein